MSKFENHTFPSEEAEYPVVHGEHSFTGCHFKQGTVLIPTLPNQLFESCHFDAGSILLFVKSLLFVRFVKCTFDHGSSVHFLEGCGYLTLDGCSIPTDRTRSVFSGGITGIYLIRKVLDEDIPFVEGCGRLYISDGHARGEITKPFSIPRNLGVTYSNTAPLFDNTSLDNLVHVSLRYPQFRMSTILWEGSQEYMAKCIMMLFHPRRREVSCILVLLSVLPSELIRSEFTQFLI